MTSSTVEADGPDACVVTTGVDDAERMALYLALVGCDFEILEPPEVADGAVRAADRLRLAAAKKHH